MTLNTVKGTKTVMHTTYSRPRPKLQPKPNDIYGLLFNSTLKDNEPFWLHVNHWQWQNCTVVVIYVHTGRHTLAVWHLFSCCITVWAPPCMRSTVYIALLAIAASTCCCDVSCVISSLSIGRPAAHVIHSCMIGLDASHRPTVYVFRWPRLLLWLLFCIGLRGEIVLNY